MSDVLCLGEILVDWVCTTVGAELDRAQMFTKAPGGAPANTAVGLARLGVPTGFMGRVADDAFGRWLQSVLVEEGVDTAGTVVDQNAQTRMAYVVTTMTGDRKLAEFSKIACADARIEPQDLKPHLFAGASVLHFGSISLISSSAKDATKQAVELAHVHKLLVSYDPNVRIGLWPSPEVCRKAILETLQWADLVKINQDELAFLTGSREMQAADALRQEHNLPLLIVTLDVRGAYFTTASGGKLVPGFGIHLVEATGAGDGFNAGILAGLLLYIKDVKDRRTQLVRMSCDELVPIVRRANAIGALTCTRAGAIPALPTTAEVDEFMEQMVTQTSS